MLRLLGGSMIIIGCLGLGMWYRGQFILRLKNVRSLQGILEMLMSEIRYGKTPLPECCKRIGERQPEPFGEAFLGIYHCMQENPGESFPKVFCEIMEKCLQKLPVTKQDKEDFLAFAVGQSFEDGSMQLRTIERSKELLEATAKRLDKENTEKCRMAVGLGAMSGLLLVVILL